MRVLTHDEARRAFMLGHVRADATPPPWWLLSDREGPRALLRGEPFALAPDPETAALVRRHAAILAWPATLADVERVWARGARAPAREPIEDCARESIEDCARESIEDCARESIEDCARESIASSIEDCARESISTTPGDR